VLIVIAEEGDIQEEVGESEAQPAGERFLFCVRWREFGQTAGPTASITVYPASH